MVINATVADEERDLHPGDLPSLKVASKEHRIPTEKREEDLWDDWWILAAGLGFYASLDSLSLVTLKNNNGTPLVATDDKSYMALDLDGLVAKLVGIDGLTFGVYDAAVKINKASDTDANVATNPAKLDWATFFDNTTGLAGNDGNADVQVCSSYKQNSGDTEDAG